MFVNRLTVNSGGMCRIWKCVVRSLQKYAVWCGCKCILSNKHIMSRAVKKVVMMHDKHLIIILVLRLATIITLAFLYDESMTTIQVVWYMIMFISHLVLAMSWYTKPVNIAVLLIWLVMVLPFILLLVTNWWFSQLQQLEHDEQPDQAIEMNYRWFKEEIMSVCVQMNLPNSEDLHPSHIANWRKYRHYDDWCTTIRADTYMTKWLEVRIWSRVWYRK